MRQSLSYLDEFDCYSSTTIAANDEISQDSSSDTCPSFVFLLLTQHIVELIITKYENMKIKMQKHFLIYKRYLYYY